MKLYMYIKDKIRLVVDRDKTKKLYFAFWFMVLGLLSLIMFSLNIMDYLMTALLLSTLVILSHFYSFNISKGRVHFKKSKKHDGYSHHWGDLPPLPMMENIFSIFLDIRPFFETWLKKRSFYPDMPT